MLPLQVPEMFHEAIAVEREVLWELVGRVNAFVMARDVASLRELAVEIRTRMKQANSPTGGHLPSCVSDINQALDEAYDESFPLHDRADVRRILDAPWPTKDREDALRSLLDYTGYGPPPLHKVVQQALET